MPIKKHRGGTLLGFILGLLVGLGAALAVAVYVTKVPIPLVDRGLQPRPCCVIRSMPRMPTIPAPVR